MILPFCGVSCDIVAFMIWFLISVLPSFSVLCLAKDLLIYGGGGGGAGDWSQGLTHGKCAAQPLLPPHAQDRVSSVSSHKFCRIAFPFLLGSGFKKNNSSLALQLFRSVLLNFHVFVASLKFSLNWVHVLWVERVCEMISVSVNFSRLVLWPNVCPALGSVSYVQLISCWYWMGCSFMLSVWIDPLSVYGDSL